MQRSLISGILHGSLGGNDQNVLYQSAVLFRMYEDPGSKSKAVDGILNYILML